MTPPDEPSMEAAGLSRRTVRALFARRNDPYEGADRSASRRVTAALLGLSALLSLVLLPIAPPTEAIGWPGWIAAVGLIAASLSGARRLADPARSVGFNLLLAIAYAGVAGLALLEWLAGPAAPYDVLSVLWFGAGAVHPPRRAFPHLAILIGAMAVPFAWGGYDPEIGARLAAQSLLLLAVGSVLITYLFHVRLQRAGLQAGAESARRMARSDALTGLGNRRAFDEALAVELIRSRHEGATLSVGILDLDCFKRLNDHFGHLEGDRLLKDVAGAIERSVRTSDSCYRWGGDEFTVLFPDTDRLAASYVLARVMEKVASSCEDPEGRALAVSFGAAQLDPGTGWEEMLALADLALMEQKADKARRGSRLEQPSS